MNSEIRNITNAYGIVKVDSMYSSLIENGDSSAAISLLEDVAISKGYSKKIYRVDDRNRNIFVDTNGIYFASDLDYYDGSETGYDRNDAKCYLLYGNAKLFDPMKMFSTAVHLWSWITMDISDMERFGIEDETDWEEKEGLGNTSTQGLADAGKRLGYDGTILRDIPNDHGWGKPFTEYALYNSNIAKRLEITYDDDGNPILPSKRFDISKMDMRY